MPSLCRIFGSLFACQEQGTMNRYDEPPVEPERIEDAEPGVVREQIRTLVDGQPFAVLCTQGGGQPYGSLIAFATSDDLQAMAFATSVDTRMYRLLTSARAISGSHPVALVIDSRSQYPGALMQVEAITVTGRAVQLPSGPERDRWAELLTVRHPQLKSFVAAPSSALFRIDVIRYLYVTRFQEVYQWVPRYDT
jgi:nitroimidazol reductase NimA-like FMN-containing flavoprotein (pyridoxamine 5'-phosphate oxidase superfamily)